ncbi:CYTH domain-containing protein [Dyella flagellata]|uniref:CYTH domain-containing protein n=1 Tax=Dyella flagellata TaxID=1867833 RepID=A0ABQ5XAH9_9GAMM|nr:hypothetical protein [Dyella flagellata]GLQ88257.1 hypothetical protein GCM10007898_18260 [Dyella flagellata]
MNVDSHLAASLGFHTSKYLAVERERRWLCRAMPDGLELQTERITDLYVTGASLRLREARPVSGGSAILRLTRKADVDSCTRLLTTIYLSEEEFRILSSTLPSKRVHKLRHRLPPKSGVVTAIDEFQGELSGLVMAEAEFESAEQLSTFQAPPFAVLEVTGDLRFTGGALASQGLPHDLSELLAANAG